MIIKKSEDIVAFNWLCIINEYNPEEVEEIEICKRK